MVEVNINLIKMKKYLDAFDNIQRVSHSHPRIVKTAYKRLKKLNTNTKYLDKIVLDYNRICIVDEIQVSFGRIGKHFWGFNHQKKILILYLLVNQLVMVILYF